MNSQLTKSRRAFLFSSCRRSLSVILLLPLVIVLCTVKVSAQEVFLPQDETVDPQQEHADELPNIPERVIVRPKVDVLSSGWQGVEPGGKRVGNTIRSNWAMLDESGSISGTVHGLAGGKLPEMNIYVLHQGSVVSETYTDGSGKFKLEGLRTGAYTLVGHHAAGFFCYGFNTVEFRQGTTHFPTSISTKAIASRENKIALTALVQAYAPEVGFPIYGDYEIAEDEASQENHFGWAGLGKFDVESTPATTIKSNSITLRSGGRFSGRVHQIHDLNGRPVNVSKTRVILIANGEGIVETKCNRYGVFEFSGIESGEYGLIAAGGDGIAAIGIKLVGGSGSSRPSGSKPGRFGSYQRSAKPALVDSDHGTTLVSNSESTTKSLTAKILLANDSEVLDLTLVQPEAIGWINDHVTKRLLEEYAAMPRPGPGPEMGPGFGAGHIYCGGCLRIHINSRPSCSCGR